MSLKINKIYLKNSEEIAELLYKRGLFEDCINYIHNSCTYAWYNFSGSYTGYKFENILKKIADKTLQIGSANLSENKRPKKLHVFSQIFKTGGHTRLLFNWIERDVDFDHHIIATNQSEKSVIDVCNHYNAKASIVSISVLSGVNLEKAQNLLDRVLEQNFFQIILHVHPDDIIPVLAFSNVGFKSPVLLLNHADHIFWIGSSIVDLLIQIRESNYKLDFHRRQIPLSRQALLPIPVKQIKLGTKRNSTQITLLTIGSNYKFKPNWEYNLFKELFEIVTKNPNVICYIIGVDSSSEYYQKYAHPSIICTGKVKNLLPYYEIADIYIEGFPFPSFTALLEVSMMNIPFLLHYNPTNSLKLFEDNKDSIVYPINVHQWRDMLKQLIENDVFRKNLAAKQFVCVYELYSEKAWLSYLKKIDILTNDIYHQLYSKPNNIFLNGRNEESILQLRSMKIDYFGHTRNLNLLNRTFLFFKSFSNNMNHVNYSTKEKLAYIMGKFN